MKELYLILRNVNSYFLKSIPTFSTSWKGYYKRNGKKASEEYRILVSNIELGEVFSNYK